MSSPRYLHQNFSSTTESPSTKPRLTWTTSTLCIHGIVAYSWISSLVFVSLSIGGARTRPGSRDEELEESIVSRWPSYRGEWGVKGIGNSNSKPRLDFVNVFMWMFMIVSGFACSTLEFDLLNKKHQLPPRCELEAISIIEVLKFAPRTWAPRSPSCSEIHIRLTLAPVADDSYNHTIARG